MAEIAVGSGSTPGLPPIDLPSLDAGPPPRLRIEINRQAQGAWQPEAWSPPQQAAPPADTGVPWKPEQWTPAEPPREVGAGEASLRGAARGLSFGTEPGIAGAVSGIGSVLGGGNFSDAYNRTRQAEYEANQAAEAQHPYIFTGSEIAGSIPTLFLPGVGAGKAAVTAAEFGPRILQAARAGAAAGGLFGGGEQLSAGGGAGDIAQGAAGGALMGAALGGALGSGVEGATAIGRRVASVVRGNRNADAEASRLVADALKTDQAQVQSVAQDRQALVEARRAGLSGRVVDFGGGKTKALLRAATNMSPEARDIVGDVVYPRFQQQAERIGQYIRSNFSGTPKDIGTDAIKEFARKQNGPAYRAAYAQGDRPIWSPELERLTTAPYVQAAFRDALAKWKNYAVRDGYGAANPPFRIENGGLVRAGGKGLPAYPNIQLWDYVARDLQDRAREAPIGSEAGKLYNDLARLLKTELDKAVPAYKTAREGAASLFKASDALEAGANFVSDASISEPQAARALAKMNSAERELFARGFAGELAAKIERTGDNRDVLNSIFLANSRARKRIEIALGQEGAGRLEALLRIEGIFDRTRKALGNSTTTQQLSDAGQFAGTFAAIEGLKGTLNPAYLIAAPLIWAGRQTAKKSDERVFTRVAEMLLSKDTATVTRALDIAVKNPTVRTALRYASDLSARDLVGILGPSGVASGALTIGHHLTGTAKELPKGPPEDYYNEQGQQPASP